MRNWLKVTLKITGVFVCLLLLAWCSLAIYVYSHKTTVLNRIVDQLNEHLNGKLTVETMEPTLLRGFPGISVSLRNVTLRDSLWAVHHRDLLHARDIFVSVDILSLLKNGASVRNIRVSDAAINLFTDSSGYSNASVFRKRKKGNSKAPSISSIMLVRTGLIFEEHTKHKLFRFFIRRLETQLEDNSEGWNGRLNTSLLVHDLCFNTDKGSFLKERLIDAKLSLRYNEAKDVLIVPMQDIRIDGQRIQAGATFLTGQSPVAFTLRLRGDRMKLRDAASYLSPNISRKLKAIDLKEPVTLSASIAGRMKYRDTPLVLVQWQVNRNTLVTPLGDIEDCSFSGVFTNDEARGKGHTDPNSRISLYALKGSWEQIPFSVDTLHLRNLLSPVLEGRFRSVFPLVKLNSVIGGRSFAFREGQGRLDLTYKGGISKEDTTRAYVYGTILARNATIDYLPRALHFRNSSADIRFRGRDILINSVKLTQGSTGLQMDGSMLNFLSLYYTDPGKMILDWRIRSSQVVLDDFMGFLGARRNVLEPEKARKKVNANAAAERVSSQMDKLLADASVRLKLTVGKLLYRSFEASNIDAALFLGSQGISLDHINVDHAGGSLSLRGTLDQKSAVNGFQLNALVSNVDVQRFFSSFRNFGQDAITDRNVKGRLFADAAITGRIADNGKILPYSLMGDVRFDLQDGALKDFEPVKKIGKFIFRNRDLSNVTISKLQNTLHLQGDKVLIDPMFIESSLLNVQLDGIYGFNKGTDINIDVPLRNPKRSELILDDSLRMEQAMKGLVVHLKAVDGDDGNVKIKWLAKPEKKEERTSKRRRNRSKP